MQLGNTVQMSSLQELPGAAGQLYAANTMINQAVVGMKKEVDAQAKTVVPLNLPNL